MQQITINLAAYTAHIYDLRVSVGQKSGRGIGGSLLLDFLQYLAEGVSQGSVSSEGSTGKGFTSQLT